MQECEAIVLAGGLGTRLREAVPELPKCMAPVAGRPFLFFVINYLRSQGIEKFIFSLGYKHEAIERYLEEQFPTLQYTCKIEPEPLGTGGAIRFAAKAATSNTLIVANGDTLFRANLQELLAFHKKTGVDCTLALKPMEHFDRYGVVELDKNGRICQFKEKQFYTTGLINGGIYVLQANAVLEEDFPAKFSFEKDYLEKKYVHGQIAGLVQKGYFIDIGIPEDFNRAQQELQKPPLDLKTIDKSWTIFLDRDGVINYEKKDAYVLNWGEFRFHEGVKEAIKILHEKCGSLVVISNQRGVGKQLMTEENLQDIHRQMITAMEQAGGRIDAIYYCSSLDNKHPDRKPNPGMAFRAAREHPEIDLSKTIMVGNKPSDMQFGRNAGLYTVFIKTTNPEQPVPHPDIDWAFDSLISFAKAL
jgi:D-glycero-alpha-D-manno-heptose 1-phosphate guanylyltransferase